MVTGLVRRAWKRLSGEASMVQSIAALVALAMLLLTLSATWTAQQANELAVDRQVRLAHNAIEQEQERLTEELGNAAVSEDAYRRVHLRFDPDYAARTFGERLWREHHHDLTIVVGPGRNFLQAHVAGRATQPRDLRPALGGLSQLIDRLRLQVSEASHRPDGSEDPALLAGQVLREKAILEVDGRVSLVAAVALTPASPDGAERAVPPTLVVTVRHLAGDLLERMARQYVLPDLAFAPGDAGGRAAVPVRDREGRPLGQLVWRPHQPGYQMMQHLAPLILLAMALFVAFAIIVGGRYQRRTTELAASEARANHSALHDALSGLANRVLLGQRIDEALDGVRRDPTRPAAIVYVDLDRFKDVNDTLGHQAGDEVIKRTAERLAALARPEDTAARISGDEFALVLRSAPDRAEIEKRLAALVAEIGRPIPWGERTIYPGGSVGCAVAPYDGLERAELQRKADLALYRAKAEGRGRWFVYANDMEAGQRQKQALRQDLREAIAEGRLTVLYQPYFSVAEMKAVGVEARIAWDHPTRGRIPAAEFIPLAEESGLVKDIGAFVLRRAARDARRWPGLRVTVNVSPIEVRQSGFAADLLRILADEEMEPARLQVDITENVLLNDADVAIGMIETLRRSGVGIALDEFGSGQSSFNYLSRFRFDTIKIDRAFVAKLETSDEVATILQSMVELAGKLGLETVAEGVETFGQFRFIQACGCTTVQGHLCAKPMPAAEVGRLIEGPLAERLRVVA